MVVFVDMQFYRIGSSYIVKELAILGGQISHYIFESLFEQKMISVSDKEQMAWLLSKNNDGHKAWDVGCLPYCKSTGILKRELSQGKVILVKA